MEGSQPEPTVEEMAFQSQSSQSVVPPQGLFGTHGSLNGSFDDGNGASQTTKPSSEGALDRAEESLSYKHDADAEESGARADDNDEDDDELSKYVHKASTNSDSPKVVVQHLSVSQQIDPQNLALLNNTPANPEGTVDDDSSLKMVVEDAFADDHSTGNRPATPPLIALSSRDIAQDIGNSVETAKRQLNDALNMPLFDDIIPRQWTRRDIFDAIRSAGEDPILANPTVLENEQRYAEGLVCQLKVGDPVMFCQLGKWYGGKLKKIVPMAVCSGGSEEGNDADNTKPELLRYFSYLQTEPEKKLQFGYARDKVLPAIPMAPPITELQSYPANIRHVRFDSTMAASKARKYDVVKYVGHEYVVSRNDAFARKLQVKSADGKRFRLSYFDVDSIEAGKLTNLLRQGGFARTRKGLVEALKKKQQSEVEIKQEVDDTVDPGQNAAAEVVAQPNAADFRRPDADSKSRSKKMKDKSSSSNPTPKRGVDLSALINDAVGSAMKPMQETVDAMRNAVTLMTQSPIRLSPLRFVPTRISSILPVMPHADPNQSVTLLDTTRESFLDPTESMSNSTVQSQDMEHDNLLEGSIGRYKSLVNDRNMLEEGITRCHEICQRAQDDGDVDRFNQQQCDLGSLYAKQLGVDEELEQYRHPEETMRGESSTQDATNDDAEKLSEQIDTPSSASGGTQPNKFQLTMAKLEKRPDRTGKTPTAPHTLPPPPMRQQSFMQPPRNPDGTLPPKRLIVHTSQLAGRMSGGTAFAKPDSPRDVHSASEMKPTSWSGEITIGNSADVMLADEGANSGEEQSKAAGVATASEKATVSRRRGGSATKSKKTPPMKSPKQKIPPRKSSSKHASPVKKRLKMSLAEDQNPNLPLVSPSKQDVAFITCYEGCYPMTLDVESVMNVLKNGGKKLSLTLLREAVRDKPGLAIFTTRSDVYFVRAEQGMAFAIPRAGGRIAQYDAAAVKMGTDAVKMCAVRDGKILFEVFADAYMAAIYPPDPMKKVILAASSEMNNDRQPEGVSVTRHTLHLLFDDPYGRLIQQAVIAICGSSDNARTVLQWLEAWLTKFHRRNTRLINSLRK